MVVAVPRYVIGIGGGFVRWVVSDPRQVGLTGGDQQAFNTRKTGASRGLRALRLAFLRPWTVRQLGLGCPTAPFAA